MVVARIAKIGGNNAPGGCIGRANHVRYFFPVPRAGRIVAADDVNAARVGSDAKSRAASIEHLKNSSRDPLGMNERKKKENKRDCGGTKTLANDSVLGTEGLHVRIRVDFLQCQDPFFFFDVWNQ